MTTEDPVARWRVRFDQYRSAEDRNRFAHVYDARAFDALAARAGAEYLPMLDVLAERLGREAA